MSALGQKRTSRPETVMSALPPKADIAERDRHVRFVPSGLMNATRHILLDYLIGTAKQCDRKAETQRLGSLKIDDQFNFALLHNGQVADLFTF